MKTIISFLLLVLVLIGSGSLVYADSIVPPRDYQIEVGSGEFTFVMLTMPWNEGGYGGTQDLELREVYGESGLYRVGEPDKPLWTIDWYESWVELSDDGRYLVRHGPWPVQGEYNTLAIAFYDRGELLAEYKISDLVDSPSDLRKTVSHYFWRRTVEFDSQNQELLLITEEDQEYIFDITTGRIKTGRNYFRFAQYILWGGVFVLGSLLWWRKRKGGN